LAIDNQRLYPLVHRAVLDGLLYGPQVYFVMNRVVLPPSAVPFRTRLQVSGLIVHMFLVGLPVALSVRRCSPHKPAARPGA
jgi:hypothetical protein